MYEEKIAELIKQVEDKHARLERAEEQLDLANKLLSDQQVLMQVNSVSAFSRINEILTFQIGLILIFSRGALQGSSSNFKKLKLRCLCISKMPTIISGWVYLLGLGHSSSVLQVSLIFHPFLFAIL